MAGLSDDEVRALVPDPLPLRSHPMPPQVSQVEGCDCGGLEFHRSAASWSQYPACSIWQLPPDVADARVAEARARMDLFTAELTRKLRQETGW